MEHAVSRRFCVLTMGRAASTALMDSLEGFEDVAVPNKNVPCVDNELIHPLRTAKHIAQYADLTGGEIEDPAALVEAFYRHNASFRFAGFKTMPGRIPGIEAFVIREDIRFITLVREDLVSAAASFLVAMATGSWRRYGEAQPARWTFDPAEQGPWLEGNLDYLCHCREFLAEVPRAIPLRYEDLCDPDFQCPGLDDFFERPVRLETRNGPVTAQSYIENWDEFQAFAIAALRRRRSAMG